MPKKISDFLIGLARKSGFELSQEQQDYLKTGEFDRLELADEIGTGIDNSLISLKDAKNNHSDIKNHYVKSVYDGFDAQVVGLMDELEFGDNERNTVLTERNSNKRLPLLVKLVKDLEHRKANADKPDKAAINKQIEDFNTEIRNLKAVLTQKEEEYKKQRIEDRIDAKKDFLYTPYKTIYDTLNPEVKATTIRALVNKELQDNNGKFAFDDNGNFVLLKKDGTNYYGADNQQRSPLQFVEQLLSRENILVTTPKATQPVVGDTNQQNGQNPGGGTAASGGNGKTAQTHLLKELNANSRKDILENAANPIFGGGVGP